MSMAVSVGLGVGAAGAAVITVGSTWVGVMTSVSAFFVARGTAKDKTVPQFLKQNNRWETVSAFAMVVIGSAVVACSSGYVSFMLAKAVWLKIAVPSLTVPLKAAVGGGLLSAVGLFRMFQLLTAAKKALGANSQT